MDLSTHFKNYQEVVIVDLPPGFGAYQREKGYAEIFIKLVAEIKDAISSNDRDSYFSLVNRHRETLLKALIDMDIPEGEGVKFFKFSKIWIYFDKFIWVPRFTSEKTPLPKFTTFEVNLILQQQPPYEIIEQLYALKKNTDLIFVGLDGKKPLLMYPEDINSEKVRDWTLPL